MRLALKVLIAVMLFGSSVFASPETRCRDYAHTSEGAGLGLSVESSEQLCAGAIRSSDPVDCYRYAVSPHGGRLDLQDAISLCRGGSVRSVYCFVYGVDGLNPISKETALTLCGGPSSERNLRCYPDAIGGMDPISPERALAMCKARQ